MKYIMVRKRDQYFPVVFPEMLTHADVAKNFIGGGGDPRHLPGLVVSAGFVNPDTYETTGYSESLNLSPRPEDSLLIQTFFRQGEGMLMCIGPSIAEGRLRSAACFIESMEKLRILGENETEPAA